MQKLNDLSRSLNRLDPDGTLIAVIELSLSSWLVAGGSRTSSRAGAVKVGRRANVAACSELRGRWPPIKILATSGRCVVGDGDPPPDEHGDLGRATHSRRTAQARV
jgi:hypothetical protein